MGGESIEKIDLKTSLEFEIANVMQSSSIICKVIKSKGRNSKEFDISNYNKESRESLKVLIDAGKNNANEYFKSINCNLDENDMIR